MRELQKILKRKRNCVREGYFLMLGRWRREHVMRSGRTETAREDVMNLEFS